MPNAESENKLQTKLNRLSEIARVEPKTKFISLAHLLNEKNLRQCYEELKKDAASGIDKLDILFYLVNLFEEPCAGILHARFCEGRLE